MIKSDGARFTRLSPATTMTLLSTLSVVVAATGASLVSEAAFRLLSDVDVVQVRSAIWATALLVAVPLSLLMARIVVQNRRERVQLLRRNRLLGVAQAYAKQGEWEFDASSGRFALSDALHHLLGDPDKTLRLTVPLLLEMVNPQDRIRLSAALDRMLVSGSEEQIEYRIRGLDGQERTFWVTGTRLLGPDGSPIRAFGIGQDITEQKATEAALKESEDHYWHAVELSPWMPWVEDAEGNTLEVSNRWFELTGLKVEDSLGKGWTESIHPDDLQLTEETWQRALQTGEPYQVDHRVRVADGSYRWFRSRATARRDESGRIVRWYGSVEDIHEAKAAEIALRESEAFANSILGASKDCIDVVDLEGRLLFMNSSCRQLMELCGYRVFVGKEWIDLWRDDLKPMVQQAVSMARTGAPAHFNFYGLTNANIMGYWDVSISPILGSTGEPERLLCVSRDITIQKVAQDELERAREEAEEAARHDSLTGLPNRPYFRQRLDRQLGTANSHNQVAVLFLDLDEFKSVNDSLGHPAGDHLLRVAAERLRTCLRADDLVARFGGDEFAIMQVNVAETVQVESLAQRIISCLSQPYTIQDREVVIGTSIGVALAFGADGTADDLLREADIALYRAKSDGRGVYRFFEDGMGKAAEERQQLRSELRDAVARAEFRVHYQPIVSLETSRVTSFEALVRWQHPRRGLLSPAEFISHAEETGDVEEIGAWVLTEACAMAATWPEGISVAVNLSPRQFRSRCLTQAVSEALLSSGLPAHRLQLEITESVLLEDDQLVRDTLEKLRHMGVRIAIDDFGTGYSSLGYLRRFSVDNIKIDRSFVIDLSENTRTAAILSALAVLSRGLGVSVTAEGIETLVQLEKLKAMGCHQGQGYLFSPALPADAVSGFLSSGCHSAVLASRNTHVGSPATH